MATKRKKLIDLELLSVFSDNFQTYIDKQITAKVAAEIDKIMMITDVTAENGSISVTTNDGTKKSYTVNNVTTIQDIQDMIAASEINTTAICQSCPTNNTAKVSDIQAMLNDSSSTLSATGDPITNDAGCSIQTTSSEDITELVDSPESLDTTTDKNTYVTPNCIAEVTSTSSPTMSVDENGNPVNNS